MKNLKIQSISGYCDRDELMLHACFQILVDFVNREWDGGKGWRAETFGGLHDLKKSKKQMEEEYGYPPSLVKSELESLKRSNKITQEIWDLYNWWTKTRPRRSLDKRWKKRLWDKKNGDFVDDVEDTKMLDRLMKVRRNLWT